MQVANFDIRRHLCFEIEKAVRGNATSPLNFPSESNFKLCFL